MKNIYMVLGSLLLINCSENKVEEFVFRETLQHDLIKLCDKDEKCIEAVKNQIQSCMVSSKWIEYLNSEDDKKEFERFITEFYSCIVDEEGNPYFYPDV